MKNIDQKTVASFGDEWSRFDQSGMSDGESKKIFEEYFAVFPWEDLPKDAVGFDMGCGSGRWARWVAPKVGSLNCIEPSNAIDVARQQLSDFHNVQYYRASVDSSGLPNGSQDFGYSLGVLHHVPDTGMAIQSCADLLKKGAPLLLYLYYAFDNRPLWFRLIWKISDGLRHFISRMPPAMKHIITDMIAVLVYWPMGSLSKVFDKLGLSVENIPLSYYRNHSFYTMRTDSRDRFGTPLEKRFTRRQIIEMMGNAGLVDIKVSDGAPFWCVVGRKA